MLRCVCPSVSHFIMKHPNHPTIVQILVSTCLPWCCTENSTNAPCTGAPSGSGTCQKSLRPEFSNILQFWATKTTNRLQNMALTELPSKYNFVTLVCLQNRATSKCWAFVGGSGGLAWFALKGVAESCLGGSGLWLVLQSNLPSNCASAIKASWWSNPRSLIWCIHTGGACILVMVVDPIQLQ